MASFLTFAKSLWVSKKGSKRSCGSAATKSTILAKASDTPGPELPFGRRAADDRLLPIMNGGLDPRANSFGGDEDL